MWKKEEYGDDKCINCGYLGKKDTQGFGRECFIASAEERTTGNLAHHIIPGMSSLTTVPWCFCGKFNLKDEVDQLDDPQINEVSRIFSVLTKDRHCPSWYPWREFSSPKEQWDESVMLAMEKRQQDFEIQMEKERRGFEVRLQELNERDRKRTNRVMIGLAVAAVFFAIAQVIVALAAINPEHWLFQWLR